jgi:ATP-dependent protease Clp ATPase subunit
MVDLMYQLPEETNPARYVITESIVDGIADLATAKQKLAKKESA